MSSGNINQFKPIPFYFLNTCDREDYSPERCRESMHRLAEAGYGGAILFNKPPTGFDTAHFLEEPWFYAIGNLLDAAETEHLSMWINDGWDYPPGDAAGRIEARNPELYQRQLVLNADGKVEVMKTPWGFPAFEEPESSRLFIEIVYEEYFRRFRHHFGKTLVGFFSDADNRRISAAVVKQLAGQIYFPWSRDFSHLFEARFGYRIEPYLPDILDLKDIPQNSDYWALASELYHNWFAGNCKWCHEHGLLYSFHTSDTGPLSFHPCRRSSIYSEGEMLKLSAHCDYPGTDHELLALDGGTHYDQRYFTPHCVYAGAVADRRRPAFADTLFDVRAKYAASSAVLHHRERTLCEMFAAANWGATTEDLRRIAAWQIMQGVNFIVPHAVHHKFFGPTKFFAPPEFMHNYSPEALLLFNGWLAKFCMIAAQGEYVPEAVVIDPERFMQKHAAGPGKFFEICDKLNRENYNFIVVPSERAAEFHCPVLDPYAESLPELPPPSFTFDGGVVASMIRTFADGSRMLLLSNLWSDETLAGNLHFDGRNVELELSPGEIAVIGGEWETFRVPQQPMRTAALPQEYAVKWFQPNVIPCHHKHITLEISAAIGRLHLLIPEKTPFEAAALAAPTKVKCFDDVYRSYELPATPGIYHYDLPECPWETPVRIEGDFDVKVLSAGALHQAFADYDLTMDVPDDVTYVLTPRRSKLHVQSWAEQGQPFYSGAAQCTWEFDGSFTNAVLCLPEVYGSAAAKLDGKSLGEEQIFPPFCFSLGKIPAGRHHLELVMHNTLANALECYSAPGGVLAVPRIEEFEE